MLSLSTCVQNVVSSPQLTYSCFKYKIIWIEFYTFVLIQININFIKFFPLPFLHILLLPPVFIFLLLEMQLLRILSKRVLLQYYLRPCMPENIFNLFSYSMQIQLYVKLFVKISFFSTLNIIVYYLCKPVLLFRCQSYQLIRLVNNFINVNPILLL